MFTHTLGITYRTDAGTIANVSLPFTGNWEGVDLDVTINAGATNVEYDAVVTIAQVQSLLMFSDQAVTLKTNSSGSPQDTINIKAGVPIAWNINSFHSIPFAGNVTKLFFTNSGGSPAHVNFRVLANV